MIDLGQALPQGEEHLAGQYNKNAGMSDLADEAISALESQLFPEKVRISILTKSKGPLTKIIRLEDGRLIKDGSECRMISGIIKTVSISSPDGFARMLRTREPNQAITHGVSDFPEARVFTASSLGKQPVSHRSAEALPIIARTKEFIRYPDGPGLMMFDHDKARENAAFANEAAVKSYKPAKLISLISTLMPEIAHAAWVSTPSTTACISDKDGKELRDEGAGSHTYLFVENGKDIPRFLEVLGKRLTLAGYSRVEISRSGSLLHRVLVDLTVGSPERLDFVAGAVCEDGLVQKLPAPTINDGALLDTALLPDLTQEEELRYITIKDRMAELARPSQVTVRSQYVELEAGKLVKEQGLDIEAARMTVLSRQDHVLTDSDHLYFAHNKGQPVTVADVLNDPASYDKKPLADPLEPEYDGGSMTKARFFWNDGKPIINSFAHGQTKYTFERFQQKTMPASEPIEDGSWFRDAVKHGSVARFLDNPKPELDFIFADSLLSATVGLLVGPGAAGKSTLSILLLMAIATGRDILPGIFTPTRAGKVLGVFAEDCEEVLHHRIRDIANALFFFDDEAKGLLRENMTVVSVPGHDLRLFGAEQQNMAATEFYKVVKEVASNIADLRLLVIDPLSRFHGEEENDNGAGTYFVSLLEKIAQSTRAAVVVLHHVGKRSGYQNSEFNLEAAMSQDCARGASGLTNGVRWQCNLFGIPEKNARNILGVEDAVPGQYLALRVSKKNYGKPEPVHYMERGHGGMLKPVEPILKDGCSYDVTEAVFKLVASVVDGQQLTKRMLADAYHSDWKQEHPDLSRTKLESALAGFITKGRLFEIKGRNKSGKQVWLLSTINPEPDEPDKVPDKVPDDFEPDEPDRTGQNAVRFNKCAESYSKSEPDKNEPDSCLSGSLSTRNHGTVEPDKTPPYGGIESPSGSPGQDYSPIPKGLKNAVRDEQCGEHNRMPEVELIDLTDAAYESDEQEDEDAIYI